MGSLRCPAGLPCQLLCWKLLPLLVLVLVLLVLLVLVLQTALAPVPLLMQVL